jgi:hypothetical protein
MKLSQVWCLFDNDVHAIIKNTTPHHTPNNKQNKTKQGLGLNLSVGTQTQNSAQNFGSDLSTNSLYKRGETMAVPFQL